MSGDLRIITSVPPISNEEIIKLVKGLYGFDDFTVKFIPSDEDSNFHIKAQNNEMENEFIFKVKNIYFTEESHRPILLKLIEVMQFLTSKGINCPATVDTISGNHVTLASFTFGDHFVKMQRFIPGIALDLAEQPFHINIFYDIGEHIGKMEQIFETMPKINELDRSLGSFDYKLFGSLKDYGILEQIKDEEERKIMIQVIEQYNEHLVPHWNTLPDQLVHGDCSYSNIIVEKVGEMPCQYFSTKTPLPCYKFNGIIDFGCMHYTKRMFELAICMSYNMAFLEGYNKFSLGGHILAGYRKVRNLSELEISLLKYAIMGRLVMSLIHNRFGRSDAVANPEETKKKWKFLCQIYDTPNEDLITIWKNVIESYET